MESSSNVHLYEVTVENRVVYRTSLGRKKLRSMKGRQGDWYPERFYILARSEESAGRIAIERLKSRRIMGRSEWAAAKYFSRQIKIIEIKEMGK